MTSFAIPNTESADRSRSYTTVMNSSSSELSELMLQVISPKDDEDRMLMHSDKILDDACYILRQFIEAPTKSIESIDVDKVDISGNATGDKDLVSLQERRVTLSVYASTAAERFCQIAHDSDSDTNNSGRKNRKRTWEALQNAAGILQNDGFTVKAATNTTEALPIESNALAVCMVFGALSFLEQQHCLLGDKNSGSAKAAASALSSTISRNKLLRKTGQPIASLVLQCYLDYAFQNEKHCFDLSILNHLAKSFRLTEEHIKPHIVAAIVRNSVQMIDAGEEREDFIKQSVSGGFALACQLRPWSILSPVELMDVATAYDFYHSAEEICRSAHKAAEDTKRLLASGFEENSSNESADARSGHQYSATTQDENAVCAVEKLIDIAIEGRMYRRADAMATSLYKLGGSSRFVEARYLHACDTIAKVISKRQFPIVDRQIERVDKAIAKVEATNGGISDTEISSPSVEIREYALQKFEEVGEIAAAQRLASLYDIEYEYDEEAALLAAAKRREKYLQYEDVLPGEVAPLITEPSELISGFGCLLAEELKEKLIGFDAEWDEETNGAALLQLASTEKVLLIDILALSSTEEGTNALQQTVGKLFENPEWTVIGFACRQDLSRLRASPCAQITTQNEHWMHTTKSVVDVQPLIGEAEESLRTTGLSRACEQFLGKPLDKAEQCSLWSGRPLSERQRSYASLDAWVCVGIYQKLLILKTNS